MSPFSGAAPSQQSIHSLERGGKPASHNSQEHVDYKEPRALHGRGGARPVRLSAFEDPIWEVVQDMREQRMSLCQSYRQYVFVHAAIIEGALIVVDEERARAGVTWRVSAHTPRRGGMGMGRPTRPKLFLVPSDEVQSQTSSTGKRLASPTELPKEDKKGELALSKRPSIKRKQASADEYAHPLPTYPPP
jgi:protein-tyrosine phosphatase